MHDISITIIVLLGLVVFFLLLPAKYDPAIKLKEWNERRRNS